MPRYDYYCANCGVSIEITKPMVKCNSDEMCRVCGERMAKQFMGQNINTPNKDYRTPIVSHSLAMHPTQIREHNKLFPDIHVQADGCPVFDNFKKHDDYLKQTGHFKETSRIKKRGTVTKLRQ